jgi:phage recombination protein Bet
MNAITVAQPRIPMPQGTAMKPEEWRVLTDAIFPSAKSAEAIVLAMQYCAARKLDVFKRPVHIVPMWNSSLGREVETVWPGINELQTTAARTGQWAGMDEPKWGPLIRRTFTGKVKRKDGWQDVTVNMEVPEWCSVTVWRLVGGQRFAFSEPVYWLEAYSRTGRSDVPNDMWQKRARGQLHKVAKAASLRAAFPEEMGNDYAAEEMEGKEIDAGGIVIEGVAERAEPVPLDPMGDPAPRVLTLDTAGKLSEVIAALENAVQHATTAEELEAATTHAKVTRAVEVATNGFRKRLDDALAFAGERMAQMGSGDGWPGPDAEAGA